MNDKDKLYKNFQTFLNQRSGSAVACGHLEYRYHRKDGTGGFVNIEGDLSVSDCSRTIHLDFTIYGDNEDEFANALYKARQLRAAADFMEKTLLEIKPLRDEALADIAAKKKIAEEEEAKKKRAAEAQKANKKKQATQRKNR